MSVLMLWRIDPFLYSDRETTKQHATDFNKQEQTAAARERFSKHVPAATDTHATMKLLLETGFCTVIRARGYK
jgi:hypothetical protein